MPSQLADKLKTINEGEGLNFDFEAPSVNLSVGSIERFSSSKTRAENRKLGSSVNTSLPGL